MLGTPKSVIWLPEVRRARREIATRIWLLLARACLSSFAPWTALLS